MTDVVVTGAGGALGSVVLRVLVEQRKSAMGFISARGPAPHVGRVLRVDLLDVDRYRDTLLGLAPRVVIHLAAVSQVAAAYRDPDHARALNVDATVELLGLCASLGARLVYASTDLVFDGEAAPYDEHSTTEPCSFYGRTKLEAECHVLAYRHGLVLRLPLLYGLPEVDRPPTFFETTVRALQQRRRVSLFTDEVRTPLWLQDAAQACVALSCSELTGVVHLGGPERLSRFEMGQRVASALGADEACLSPTLRELVPAPEPRARDVSLRNLRYESEFGGAVGRAMAEALPLIFSQGPSRLLS